MCPLMALRLLGERRSLDMDENATYRGKAELLLPADRCTTAIPCGGLKTRLAVPLSSPTDPNGRAAWRLGLGSAPKCRFGVIYCPSRPFGIGAAIRR
jgi:hypothetical protein